MTDESADQMVDLAEVPRWQIVQEKHGRYYNAAAQELQGDLERIESTFLRRYGVKPVIRSLRKPRVL